MFKGQRVGCCPVPGVKSEIMAMEIVLEINTQHDDEVVSLAFNRMRKEIYSASQGVKDIKVITKPEMGNPCLTTKAGSVAAKHALYRRKQIVSFFSRLCPW